MVANNRAKSRGGRLVQDLFQTESIDTKARRMIVPFSSPR